nr:hypothetical protein [Tanacetum cinerariifolium]
MDASLPLIKELTHTADSDMTKDQLIVLFEREVVEDVDKIMDFRRLSSELREAVRKRDGYIAKLGLCRSCDNTLGTIEMLRHMHLDDMEKAGRMLLMARETQMKVNEKNGFIMRMRNPSLLGIKSYQTQLNRTKPRWDATGFEYKQDFTVIDSPRAVTFRDKHEVQMIMWFNEIHKFSDGTLHQIDEALDYRVKEFKVNRMNPGLNTRFWTRKDVDRSKEFMFAIQKRLNTRRIFCNLESFVGK